MYMQEICFLLLLIKKGSLHLILAEFTLDDPMQMMVT
ncbi:uncharacterized protein METZ01_LOCUS265301 [marine metagenome]|uniref:Uncharacterized protein n=1 Tax=marine metagenome TaxID=408172 RepID=A0A382JMY7_9ZZZZ